MLLFILFAAAPAAAQPVPATNAAAEAPAEPPQDPFGRSTPAGTVAGFINAIAAQDYERAARYLDLSGVPASRRDRLGPDMARQFQSLLDRQGNLRPRTELSRDPAGDLADALEPDRERVGTIARNGEESPVLLRRVEGEDGTPHWLFARETLDDTSRSAARADTAPAERWLPAGLTRLEAAGAPVSHWLTLVAVATAAGLLSWLVLRLALLGFALGGDRLGRTGRFVATVALPLILFAAVGLTSWTAPMLEVSIVAREALSWLTLVIGWLAFGWLLWRLVDVVAASALQGLARRGRASATAIIRMASRTAKLLIIAVTIISVFDVFGFEVTTALAALGIGGIALALGAQKTVENLIASLSIISDRPFRVGDICRFGDRTGTVEDVGMRSSRVRTLERTLLTIPNSSLANREIENISVRDRFLFNPRLHLAGDAGPNRLRRVLTRLRVLFEGDERLLDRGARVRLLAPVEDRLPVEVLAYVLVTDLDAYLAIQEELVLAMLDILAAEGLELAPPLDLGGAAAQIRPASGLDGSA